MTPAEVLTGFFEDFDVVTFTSNVVLADETTIAKAAIVAMASNDPAEVVEMFVGCTRLAAQRSFEHLLAALRLHLAVHGG